MKQIKGILLACISIIYAGMDDASSSSDIRGQNQGFCQNYVGEFTLPSYTFLDVVQQISCFTSVNLRDILSKEGPITYKSWYEIMMILHSEDAISDDLKARFDYLVKFNTALRNADPKKYRSLEQKCVADRIVPTEDQTNTEILQEHFPWFGKMIIAKNDQPETLGSLEDNDPFKLSFHSILAILLNIYSAIQDPEMVLLNSLYNEANKEGRSIAELEKILEKCQDMQHRSPGFQEIIQTMQGVIQKSKRGRSGWIDADLELDAFCAKLREQMGVYNTVLSFKPELVQHLQSIKTLKWVLYEQWIQVCNLITKIQRINNSIYNRSISVKFGDFLSRINHVKKQWIQINQELQSSEAMAKLRNLGKIRENLIYYYLMSRFFFPLRAEHREEVMVAIDRCEQVCNVLSLTDHHNSLWQKYTDLMPMSDLINLAKNLAGVVLRISDAAKKSAQLGQMIPFSKTNIFEHQESMLWFYKTLVRLEVFDRDVGKLTDQQLNEILAISMESYARDDSASILVSRRILLIFFMNIIKKTLIMQQVDIDETCPLNILEQMDNIITKSEKPIEEDSSLSVELVESKQPEPAEPKQKPRKPRPKASKATSSQALSDISTEPCSSALTDAQPVLEEKPQPARPRITYAHVASMLLKRLYNLGEKSDQVNLYPELHPSLAPIGQTISHKEGPHFTAAHYYEQCPPEGLLKEAFDKSDTIQSTGTNAHSKVVMTLKPEGEEVIITSANFSAPSQRNGKTDIMATCSVFKEALEGLIGRIARNATDPQCAEQKTQYIEELTNVIIPRLIDAITIRQNPDMVNDIKNFVCMNVEKRFNRTDLSPVALANSITDFIRDAVLEAIPDHPISQVTVRFISSTKYMDSNPIKCTKFGSFYDFNNRKLGPNESIMCFATTIPDPAQPTAKHFLDGLISNINESEEVYFTSTSAPVKRLRDALQHKNAHIKIEVNGSYDGDDADILEFIRSVAQCPGQHSKTILAIQKDGTAWLYLGSNNWSKAGFEKNSESILMIKTKDPELIVNYIEWFNEIKSK